ncbi:2-phospho-L-lactate guanylyltransferase [Flavisphingomonas formosensis]|uniref:2-phospho-L-lactate guanylyltransferase n=1 Tax=Flavisphingomonas formosensis TaxID=861534 RepID=UPI0012FBCB02|nr:2-phospho-L-lactate guanylyltransferase [Sphingomonas formosensis]
MSWTALLPFKPPAQRKTRLAGLLDPEQRIALSAVMFDGVVAALERSESIGAIHLIAADRPDGWTGGWHADRGRGLNAELEAVRDTIGGPLLILHADLPLLGSEDVGALLVAAERAGRAIAPDRHGRGTNAVALYDDRPFLFQFGVASFPAHVGQGRAARVDRIGLALDIDSPDDLAEAVAAGFAMPGRSGRSGQAGRLGEAE